MGETIGCRLAGQGINGQTFATHMRGWNSNRVLDRYVEIGGFAQGAGEKVWRQKKACRSERRPASFVKTDKNSIQIEFNEP